MPGSRLLALGLAVGRRGHQAATLLEGRAPELAQEDLVVADVGDAAWRAVLLQQDEAPVEINELALAVWCFPHDRRRIAGEDRVLRTKGKLKANYRRALARDGYALVKCELAVFKPEA